jgi:ComF family protein
MSIQGGIFLSQFVYPAACIGCGKWYSFDAHAWWCNGCEVQRNGSSTAMRLIDDVPIFSAHRYSCEPVSRAIHQIKYGCVHAAASACAHWLMEPLKEIELQLNNPTVVAVPVPLHPRREASRGFNQSLLIAQQLNAFHASLIVDATLLRRVVHTLPQAQLNADKRATQLLTAFSVIKQPRRDATYILIDDVVTTGATLAACIKTMRAAGAARIVGLTIATTA